MHAQFHLSTVSIMAFILGRVDVLFHHHLVGGVNNHLMLDILLQIQRVAGGLHPHKQLILSASTCYGLIAALLNVVFLCVVTFSDSLIYDTCACA